MIVRRRSLALWLPGQQERQRSFVDDLGEWQRL